MPSLNTERPCDSRPLDYITGQGRASTKGALPSVRGRAVGAVRGGEAPASLGPSSDLLPGGLLGPPSGTSGPGPLCGPGTVPPTRLATQRPGRMEPLLTSTYLARGSGNHGIHGTHGRWLAGRLALGARTPPDLLRNRDPDSGGGRDSSARWRAAMPLTLFRTTDAPRHLHRFRVPPKAACAAAPRISCHGRLDRGRCGVRKAHGRDAHDTPGIFGV
jgi:hypothetical protein